MDIAHNRNYRACRSPHKSEANPAGARQFSGIASGGDRLRRDASPLFRVGGSIIAPGASHIRPTHFCRAIPKDQDRVPARMETTRWPEYRPRVRRRSGAFSFAMPWKGAGSGNSKTNDPEVEKN